MKSTVGVFTSVADAERALNELRSIGVAEDRINVLTPERSTKNIEDVPTTEGEQPGMGSAVGGVVGGALGAASGMSLGAAAASLFIPGVGPVIAMGVLGAALLGAGGAVGGAAVGDALEGSMAQGIPRDEIFFYEDALRRGRTVIVVGAENDAQYDMTRKVMERAGAESIDAARDDWWFGLRDAEEADYAAQGGDFKTDEPNYRRGFESALRPETRGKSYEETLSFIQECYGDICSERSFRRGYERGHAYHKGLSEKYKSQVNRSR
jgi:hypothetical protein